MELHHPERWGGERSLKFWTCQGHTNRCFAQPVKGMRGWHSCWAWWRWGLFKYPKFPSFSPLIKPPALSWWNIKILGWAALIGAGAGGKGGSTGVPHISEVFRTRSNHSNPTEGCEEGAQKSPAPGPRPWSLGSKSRWMWILLWWLYELKAVRNPSQGCTQTCLCLNNTQRPWDAQFILNPLGCPTQGPWDPTPLGINKARITLNKLSPFSSRYLTAFLTFIWNITLALNESYQLPIPLYHLNLC